MDREQDMKLCKTCVYGTEYELDKPCIVYRADCRYYRKVGEDMTRADAIKELSEMRTDAWTDSRQIKALNMAIKALEQEPKTGHWIFDEILDKHYYCSECKSMGVDYWDYCPNCGARMIEPQERSE